MRAKRLLALFALSLWGISSLRAGALEDVAPQRGRMAAPISWTDDTGRVRKLSDFGGYPLILLPIYTRCPVACVQNVGHLKKSLADATANPTEFRVLLFSFDPADTPAKLAEYRRREAVPLGWLVGAADQSGTDALLESIGFQYGKAGSEFTHPNLLLFLDPKLRIVKWLYGTGYSGREIDSGIRSALGRADWIGQHSDVLYALLLFAAALLCVALFHHLGRHRSRPNDAHRRNPPVNKGDGSLALEIRTITR
jgi:cytochrome oxidase Cu insertion factor (SCO1/SenC/PrrC family)